MKKRIPQTNMQSRIFSTMAVAALALAASLTSCRDTRPANRSADGATTSDSTMIDVAEYTTHKISLGPDITNKPMSSQIVEIGGKQKYMLLDNGHIYVFDWEKGIVEDSISTKACGSLHNYSGFTYISPDSILIFNSGRGEVCIVDNQGTVKGRWPLEKPRDFDPFGQTGLPPLATI